MPVVAAPNLIEQSDFSKGWMPDVEPAHVLANALQSTLNMLPVEPTKTLRTRYGFKRVTNGTLDSGYYIKHIFPYPSKDGGATYRRLILVLTNEADANNNVKIYQYNLRTGVMARIDTANRKWANKGTKPFYGVTIDGVFYGGTEDEPMFSWNGTTWSADCTTVTGSKAFDESLKLSNATSTNLNTKYPKDYAFKKDTIVSFGGRYFKFTKTPDHRYNKWEDDKKYQIGQLVTIKRAWTAGANYPISFRCIKKHISDGGNTSVNAPGTGSNWRSYWRKVTTPPPVDDDGVLRSKMWAWIPAPQRTGHGIFHGQRLWLRADDGDNSSTLQYSGILKYEDMGTKATSFGYDVNLMFDPATAFATGDSEDGGSGGMQPFGVGDGDAITALVSFNTYLLVFKRFSTWVLSGFDEASWTVRKLADVGASGLDAACEHEGLVYFIGDKGMFVTDGNSVQMVQGLENVNLWMREKLSWNDNRFNFTLWSYDGFVWMAFPMYGGRRNTHAIAYYPPDGSWWLTTLNAEAARVLGNDGSTRLYFSLPTGIAAATTAWTGTPGESTSTSTSGVTTFTNLLKNPSFEVAGSSTMPKFWDKDSNGLDARRKTGEAAYAGSAMLRVVNTTSEYQGCYQDLADAGTGTHTLSAFVKHKNGRGEIKNVTYENFRFRVGSELAENAHTYTKVGDGWFKVEATYTGSATSRPHGFRVKNNGHVFLVDKAMAVGSATPPPSFDGDGGDNGSDEYERFGTHAVLFEYDPIGMDDEHGTDDFNVASTKTNDIAWGVKTAWFPFGTANQQRRIRRIWNMLRGNGEVRVRGYRDFGGAPAFEQTFSIDDDLTSYYAEGLVMPDSSAVCIEIEGESAPGVFAGTAIDTEPRRYRYHKNNEQTDGTETSELLTESDDFVVL